MKKKAAEIAATFEKQGMSAADAMKKAWQQITDDAVRGSTKTKTSISGIKAAFSSLGTTVSRLGGLLTSVLGPISFIWLAKECIELGSSVSEVQNVVDTAFGSMSHKMEAFADTAITSFGMSELAAKKTGSTYMAMAKGIGIADGAASDMAITLTGLSGDVASFYNISQDLASTKLKSVFTGETETLKDLGVVMTQTNLEQYALSRGISKSISAMTQAELATLRYNFVLDSLNLASGDFVKTQDSWANQTRILSMQMQALGANVGQILTTVLLPAVKTLNEIVANLVSANSIISAAISSIFGVQISQNSQIASTAAEAADAENNLAAGISNAAKAAKKSLAGFDDLNILQSNTDGGSGGGGASGGGFNMSMSNDTSSIPGEGLDTAKVERVAELIKEIAGYVPVIVTALGGLKLGKFLTDLATANIETKTLKDALMLLGKKTLITLEIGVMLGSIALFGKGIGDAFKEGVDGVNFAEILGGGLVGTGVAAHLGAQLATLISTAFAGSAVDLAITQAGINLGVGTAGAAGAAIVAAGAGIILGIPTMIAGIYDAIVSGIDWLNAALISVGATAAGAGIGTIIGSLGGPIGAGVGALIGLCIGLLTDVFIFIWQHFDAVEAWFNDLPLLGKIVVGAFAVVLEMITFCVAPILAIGAAVIFVAKKFDDVVAVVKNVATNIIDYFRPVGEWISEVFQSFYQTAQDVFYNIGVIVSGCWEIIKYGVGRLISFVDETFIQPIAEDFSKLWDGISAWATDAWAKIKEVFAPAAEWIQSKVIDPINKALDALKGGMKDLINGFIGFLNSGWEKIIGSINKPLTALKNLKMGDIQPFAEIKTISVPKIPYLAQGAVLPPNKPFMAVVGDQRHGTNIEAPLATIQEAVALVMQDYAASNLAGHEATVAVLRDILEAVLGIHIGDGDIAAAAERYRSKMAVMQGIPI